MVGAVVGKALRSQRTGGKASNREELEKHGGRMETLQLFDSKGLDLVIYMQKESHLKYKSEVIERRSATMKSDFTYVQGR